MTDTNTNLVDGDYAVYGTGESELLVRVLELELETNDVGDDDEGAGERRVLAVLVERLGADAGPMWVAPGDLESLEGAVDAAPARLLDRVDALRRWTEDDLGDVLTEAGVETIGDAAAADPAELYGELVGSLTLPTPVRREILDDLEAVCEAAKRCVTAPVEGL